jgi:predicted Zn-dependent protease
MLNWNLNSSRYVVVGAAALLLLASTVEAQRGKKEVQEFTKQGLLIVNFIPGSGADMKLGRRAGDAVRSRVDKLLNDREVSVTDWGDAAFTLEKAGYDPDTVIEMDALHSLARHYRTDEYLLATVSNSPRGVSLKGELVLVRDERLRQPLPEVTAPKLDSAATLFARAVTSARAQLVPERRCENALRAGTGSGAIAAAREGIAAYARSTIARTCLLWALRQTTNRASEILTVANEVLAVDPRSFHALESAAIAHDSLRNRDAAADHWLRLVATDTGNVELALRVSYALLDGGNAKRAEPYILDLVAKYPEDLRFVAQKWRAAYENKNWSRAIEAAEVLIERDSVARRDSTFFLRLGMAYRAASKPFKAVEILARGVATFPADLRLYSLYAQYIKAEADTVIPRGLALFPKSADLLAMNAKDLRLRGKVAESLEATKRAVMLDSTLSQGQLMVAQLEMELNEPDSAIVSLHRALVRGEDTALVAAFALSKGNALYKAANGTQSSSDFAVALRMLSFADTVRSSPQSRFLTGAAALGVAQSTITEASKLKDKSASCRLTRVGADLIPVARAGLQAGDDSLAEAAKQALGYLDQLQPYTEQQLKLLCEGSANK